MLKIEIQTRMTECRIHYQKLNNYYYLALKEKERYLIKCRHFLNYGAVEDTS